MFSLKSDGNTSPVLNDAVLLPSEVSDIKQTFVWPIFSFPLLWIVALVWLAARAILILCKSRSQLIDSLGLIEPIIPEVAVDRLGDSWASIYWGYPNQNNSNGNSRNSQTSSTVPSRMRRPKIRKNLIRIGGQTIEVPGEHRRLIITDLKPDTTYKITVQPVYNTSKEPKFLLPPPSTKSQDGSVLYGFIYFHTLSSQKDQPPNSNASLKHPLPETLSEPPLVTESPVGSENAANICAKSEKILKIQQEIQEVFAQYNDVEFQFMTKYKSLMAKLSELNTKRRADETMRAQLRAENKNLEDDDHALEVKVNKLKLQLAKAERYKADSQQNIVKTTELDEMQLKEKAENDRILDELDTSLQQLQTREAELQEAIKDMAQNVKLQEKVNEEVRVIITKLRDSYQVSIKEKLALLDTEEAKCLDDSDRQRLIREIQLDGHIEWEWARAQKSSEQQYIEAYLRNSEHTAQLRIQQSQYRFGTQPQSQQGPQQQDLGHSHSGSTASSNSLASPIVSNSRLQNFRQNSLSNPHVLSGSSISSPLVAPAMGSPNPTVIHPASSFTSLNSIGSLSSMQRIPASSASHPVSSSSFDAFGITGSSNYPASGSIIGADSSTSIPSNDSEYSESEREDPVISTKTARDLLPSNLFQEDTATQAKEGYQLLGHETSRLKPKVHMEPESNDHNSPDENSLNHKSSPHWLSRSSNSAKPHRRTASLFFNSHDEMPDIFPSDNAVEEEDTVTESPSPNRSPLKGMGSRFFQKGGTRSGSFVRRLSLFSRKEPESGNTENNSLS